MLVKNPAADAGDASLIPGSGRSPGEGNGNLLQYSCLGNPMNRGAWWATIHGIAKESDRTEQLTFTFNAHFKVANGIVYHFSILISTSLMEMIDRIN